MAQQQAAPPVFCVAQNTPIRGLSGWGYDTNAEQLWFFFQTVAPARREDMRAQCTDQLFGLASPYIATIQAACRKQPYRVTLGVYVAGERSDAPIEELISRHATADNVVTTIYNRAGETEWIPAGERPPDVPVKFLVRPRVNSFGQQAAQECPIEELR